VIGRSLIFTKSTVSKTVGKGVVKVLGVPVQHS